MVVTEDIFPCWVKITGPRYPYKVSDNAACNYNEIEIDNTTNYVRFFTITKLLNMHPSSWRHIMPKYKVQVYFYGKSKYLTIEDAKRIFTDRGCINDPPVVEYFAYKEALIERTHTAERSKLDQGREDLPV